MRAAFASLTDHFTGRMSILGGVAWPNRPISYGERFGLGLDNLGICNFSCGKMWMPLFIPYPGPLGLCTSSPFIVDWRPIPTKWTMAVWSRDLPL